MLYYAHLVTAGASGFGLGAGRHYDAHAIRRLEVLLCPMAGGTTSIEPVWSADVSLELYLDVQSCTMADVVRSCGPAARHASGKAHTAGGSHRRTSAHQEIPCHFTSQ